MYSGQAGIKYGLQLKAAKPVQKPQLGKEKDKKLLNPPSIFADDEDDDVESEIAREALKKRSKREIEQQHAEALKQDASIFDYDGVYDSLKEAQAKPKEEERKQRQSKYIGALLEKAKVREREQEVLRERLLSKERAKEEHLYGDKEKFVTRAYKEKLAERARWLEEEKREEAKEAANDVTKREDLSDFYRNLMKSNVAFGGQDKQPGGAPQAEAGLPPEKFEPGVATGRAGLVGGEKGRGEEREPDGGMSKGKSAEPDPQQGAAPPPPRGNEEGSGQVAEDSPRGGGQAPPAKEQHTGGAGEGSQAEGREDKAAAARERYLARKRQRG